MLNRFGFSVFSFGLAVCLNTTLQAQDILEQLYGSGVHAFYSGHSDQAQEIFDEVINAGSQDPRVHYFRGLAQIQSQSGMIEAGMADFEQAAQLEVTSRTSANVSKALQRIQGPTRIAIEKARARARLAARSLQQEAVRGLPSNPQVVPPTDDANAKTGVDPFATGDGLNAGQPTPMPADNEPATLPSNDATMPDLNTPAPAGNTNPFGDEAVPAPAPGAAPATDNPFGI
jgi:type II secretory pathway pseudopilin PulG